METVKYNLGAVGGITVTELWSGISGQAVGAGGEVTIELNDDITNYKLLVFEFKVSYSNGTNFTYYDAITTSSRFINLINGGSNNTFLDFCWGYGTENNYYEIKPWSTTKTLKATDRNSQCMRILGIN